MSVWGYQYKKVSPVRGPQAIAFNNIATAINTTAIRWVDSTVHPAGDAVVVTPSRLQRTSLSGYRDRVELKWKYTNQDWLYVAASNSESVVVVGANRMTAFETQTGKQKWSTSIDGQVAGIGVNDGDRYHVALNSGKVSDA